MKVAKTIKDERKRCSDETRVGAGGIVTRVGKKKERTEKIISLWEINLLLTLCYVIIPIS